MAKYKYKKTRVFPIILLLIVTAVVIAALFSLARFVFFPDTTDQTTSVANKVVDSRDALLKTDANRSVRMITRGPIVADENFRSSQITINPATRIITLYTGYLDKKIDETSYANNIPAYTEFVYALAKANFFDSNAEDKDTRGVCAPGYVYVFDVLKDDKVIDSRWTSTCGGSKGSLTAYLPQVKALFDSQIPDLKSIIKKNNL